MKSFNDERAVMISCGWSHSMGLTECGHVYSWGYNYYGQSGIGNTVNLNETKFGAVIDENKCNFFIKKISCGYFHCLLLSKGGYIYAFGRNEFGEQGNQKELNELSPHRIKIETKFIDISSHWNKVISIALSQNGINFKWSKCGEKVIRTPKPTIFESFAEIYAKYLKITHIEHYSVPILFRGKYVDEFSQQSLISCGSFGIVSKVMNKNSKKKKFMPLNECFKYRRVRESF